MPDVGRKGKGKHVQSVLFWKDAKWTKASSQKWLKTHKGPATDGHYYTDGYEQTDALHRWRQVDPDDKKFRYAVTIIEGTQESPSIALLNAFPIGSPKSHAEESFKSDPVQYNDMELLFFFNLMHDLYKQRLDGKTVLLGQKPATGEEIIQYYLLVWKEMKQRDLRRLRRSELDEAAAPLFGSSPKAASFDCVILEAKQIDVEGIWDYVVGIRPDDYPINKADLRELDNRPYLCVGHILPTTKSAMVGEVIQVEYKRIELEHDQDTNSYRIIVSESRMVGKSKDVDSIDSAIEKTEKAKFVFVVKNIKEKVFKK